MKNCTIIQNEVISTILKSEEVDKANCLSLHEVLFYSRDFKTNKSYISYNKIIELLGWSRGRISKTIKELESLGIIEYDRGSNLVHKTNSFSFAALESSKKGGKA